MDKLHLGCTSLPVIGTEMILSCRHGEPETPCANGFLVMISLYLNRDANMKTHRVGQKHERC